MIKKEALLLSDDNGSTVDAVEVLIKKHDEFDKSLPAQVTVV